MNSFQVVVATDGSKTFILFIYQDMQWSSSRTTIGFNAGDGNRSYTLPGSSNAEYVLNLENTSNVGVPGVYIFRVDQDSVVEPTRGRSYLGM